MASTYLSKSISSTGDEQKFTISTWVKRSALSDNGIFISGSQSTETGYFAIYFSGNAIRVRFYEGSAKDVVTSALYRDVSAWYHIVVKVDTTQSTAADRVIIYVNGEEQNKSSATYVTQNFNTLVNTSGETHVIGATRNSSGVIGNQFDGSMAHFHFIDGTAYAASTFGETDSTSGIWKPKTVPSVTYGTNGFFLKFQDSSSLGDDSSGNTNDFTLSGSGTQTLDTPSNVFATFSPLHFGDTNPSSYGTFSNGNTRYASTQAGSPYPYTCSTLAASSGKWYAEFKITQVSNSMMVGITDGNKYQYLANNNNKDVALFYDGNKYPGNSSFGNAFSDNDICGVAMDLDNMKVYFSKNGVWQNSGDPTSGASGTGAADIPTGGLGQFHFAFGDSGGNTTSCNANFGNGYFGTTAVSSAENDDAGYGKFEYDVPAGYYALCTKNINTYG